MFLAAAAMIFAACNKEADIQENTNTEGTTTIRFSATVNNVETKATLTTEDEKTFKAEWETTDMVKLTVSGASHYSTFTAAWSGSYFEFEVPSAWTEEANWAYQAFYPAKTNIPFGSNREQNGSQYASQYDIMVSQYTTFNNSKCGYDSEGSHIVLPMTRSTSILYFHLTSELAEPLASATLTVEGGDIAAETLSFNDFSVISTDGVETSNTITLTFAEGTAPSASDFCLWYNILPVTATGLTLTVTTTSGKTATLTNTKGKTYAAGKLNKIVKKGLTWESNEKYYVKVTSIDQIIDGGQYVIGATYNNGETEAFYAIPVKPTVNNGKITGVVVPTSANGITTPEAEGYVWTLSKSGNFYALSDGEGYLYHSNGGNSGTNIAYGTSASFLWGITMGEQETNRFKFAGVNEGIVKDRGMLFNGTVFGGYALSNFNSYAGIELFVLEDDRQAIATPTNLQVSDMTLSWNPVEGAANYSVTIGNTTATAETTSYTFDGEADYYNVAVVANPSDEENYKSSEPATLENAQFGTPTLKTPVLTEGLVDETSITVTWVVDPHAEMYTCEIYDGETKVGEDLVESGSVTFANLENGKTYLIKVYADAVASPLAYAQSGIATIEIATKAKKTISTVLENGVGTYVIADVSVFAVKNNALILGDETGKVYAYKSSNTFKVGNVVTVSGEAKLYNGVFEFDNPTLTATGTTTINHGTATEMSSSAASLQEAFTQANNILSPVYVHAIGEQNDRTITVGSSAALYLSATESATNGKTVEVYGYVYAYSSDHSNFNFLVTSIEEYIDPDAATLSVEPSELTWEADETTAKTITISVNQNGSFGYEADSDLLEWASVSRSGNVITVTPNSVNTDEENPRTGSVIITHNDDASLTKTVNCEQAKAGEESEFPVEFIWTRTNSTNTITSGFTLTVENGKNQAEYIQDKDSSTGLNLLIKKSNNSALFSSTPTTVSFTAKVGGGSKKDPLANNVMAYLVDENGENIASTATVVTTKVEDTNGVEYTVTIPNVETAYGVRISHAKESGYNIRVFGASFSATNEN